MSSKPHYFAIGLFVLIGTALGIVGIISFGSDALRDPTVFLETYVDESVQGIDIGTPFKFRGVQIGSVHQIHLVSEEYETEKLYVMLRVAIDEKLLESTPEEFSANVQKVVSEGLRVQMVPQGITGLSFLDSDFFPEGLSKPLELDWEPAHTYIPSTPSMMTVLSRSLENITAQVNTIDLAEIGQNIEEITENLTGSSRNIEKVTLQISEDSESVIEHVALAAAQLPNVTSNMNASMEMVQEIVNNSDQEMALVLSNLRYITEDIKELVRMVRRHPGMVFSKPPERILGKEGKKK